MVSFREIPKRPEPEDAHAARTKFLEYKHAYEAKETALTDMIAQFEEMKKNIRKACAGQREIRKTYVYHCMHRVRMTWRTTTLDPGTLTSPKKLCPPGGQPGGLAREIRDIVYRHIWDHRTMYRAWPQIESTIANECDTKGCVLGTLNECLSHRDLPHFIKPSYMGSEVASEITEMWFNVLPKFIKYPAIDPVLGAYPDTTERILYKDYFNVGVIPAHFLKELEVKFEVNPLVNHPMAQRHTDRILGIRKKKNFNLEIQLWQKHIRLNDWPRAFDLFRPVLEEFEREGGHVRIYHRYVRHASLLRLGQHGPRREEKVERELNEAIKNPDSNWREEAIKFFDSCSAIRNSSRHYRYENEPDYDPERKYSAAVEDDDDDDDDDDDNEYSVDSYGDECEYTYPMHRREEESEEESEEDDEEDSGEEQEDSEEEQEDSDEGTDGGAGSEYGISLPDLSADRRHPWSEDGSEDSTSSQIYPDWLERSPTPAASNYYIVGDE